MEELELQEKPGLFSKLTGLFGRHDDDEDTTDSVDANPSQTYTLKGAYRYSVTVRREITTFDDAYAAANGLKRGEQQILNLNYTDPVLRQKIVDFMAGVTFAQEANWEEVGDHIYLVAPASAYVEQAPGAQPAPTRFTGSFFGN